MAYRTDTTVFEKLWQWVTEKLTVEEKKQILLVEDVSEKFVLHVVAKRLDAEVFKGVWEWAKGM
jgi:hypothetical protein